MPFDSESRLQLLTFPLISRLIVTLVALALLATNAYAGPTDSVTVTTPPTDQGEIFSPGTRLVEDLRRSYVEEEFFVSGESTLFNYAHNPPLGPTDIVATQEDVPYTTRIIVRRPVNARKFNGTVVIEWWNSTAGFDTAPSWDPSADWFAREGTIYVGVTNSTTAIDYLTTGCRLLGFLPPSCGTRYAALSLPENGLAFEALSQIANLLKSEDSGSPIPDNYHVERVFHVGESQQAGSLVTYASAFHLDGVNDGYFIQSGINARPINFGIPCTDPAAPTFPACTPRLAAGDTNVRTDLPVPVYQVVTQTDFETLRFGTRGRQADTETFRYYEVAGGSHNTVHKDVEIIPAGVFGPSPVLLEDLCANELNTTADGPVFVSYVLNALWLAMELQVDRGYEAPEGLVMDDVDGVLVRDDRNNVTGGVRMPSMEAPLAVYESTNVADPNLPPQLAGIGNLACRLSGSVIPFDQETIESLYAKKRHYVRDVRRASRALEDRGLLLRFDGRRIRRAARELDLGLPN